MKAYRLVSKIDGRLIDEFDCLLKARRRQKLGEYNQIIRASDGKILSEKWAGDGGKAIVVRVPNLGIPIILI